MPGLLTLAPYSIPIFFTSELLISIISASTLIWSGFSNSSKLITLGSDHSPSSLGNSNSFFSSPLVFVLPILDVCSLLLSPLDFATYIAAILAAISFSRWFITVPRRRILSPTFSTLTFGKPIAFWITAAKFESTGDTLTVNSWRMPLTVHTVRLVDPLARATILMACLLITFTSAIFGLVTATRLMALCCGI